MPKKLDFYKIFSYLNSNFKQPADKLLQMPALFKDSKY